MIGPLEKKFQKKESSLPKIFGENDFSALPKYICYRAALLKEKANLKILLAILGVVFFVQFTTSRLEINSLHKKLREKEYILAPGVVDFTPAHPHTVSGEYIDDAVTDLLADFGNVSATNIVEQYSRLERFMSDKLKIQFGEETKDWVKQVREENISQILHIREKEIRTTPKGRYQAKVLARAEFYGNHTYLGYEDQVISLELRLIPPKRDRRWSLEIVKLTWNKESSHQTKQHLSKGKK